MSAFDETRIPFGLPLKSDELLDFTKLHQQSALTSEQPVPVAATLPQTITPPAVFGAPVIREDPEDALQPWSRGRKALIGLAATLFIGACAGTGAGWDTVARDARAVGEELRADAQGLRSFDWHSFFTSSFADSLEERKLSKAEAKQQDNEHKTAKTDTQPDPNANLPAKLANKLKKAGQ